MTIIRKYVMLLAIPLMLCGWVTVFVTAKDASAGNYDNTSLYRIQTIEFPDLKDAKRNNRRVPIKIILPEAKGRFPLVILSHGAGGGWDSHLYQAEFLARHGYVVFCLDHTSSDTARIRYYMSRKGGHMKYVEALRRTVSDPAAMLGRPKDVSFAIDQAILWNKTDPRLRGKIDTKKIAMMGHSYGAYTTLVIVGAKPIRDHMIPTQNPPTGLIGGLADPRVTFGFAMSPQPPGHFFNQDSFKTIDRPLVCLTGPDDRLLTGDPKSRFELFKLLPPGDKYFFWINGADHLSFADSPRSGIMNWFVRSPGRPEVQRMSKALMLASCDYFLKGKKSALKDLSESYADKFLGGVVNKVTLFEK